HQNYTQAYNYFGSTLTASMTQSDFLQTSQTEDSCLGKITNYTQAKTSAQGANVLYTYHMQRAKLAASYDLQLTLAQNASGKWQITDYTSTIPNVAGC
ncbi:MAG: hypothetical protein M3Z24_10165, partial [Chloroflexota bacterium]|nr:hypothetical protein [Chloroflexota bacterium]